MSPDTLEREIDFVDDIDEHEPSEETIAACRELREGRGINFTSLDELFKYLKS
jgi:hypothetical protein